MGDEPMSIHKRKKFVPKPPTSKPALPKKEPKVEHVVVKVDKSFKQIAEEALRKPIEVKVHPLLTKPANELKPHEKRKLEIYHEFEGNIPIEDIFVDPKNGVELYRTSSSTWATSPGY
jgi:hypothetical protein